MIKSNVYLHQGGYAFTPFCLFVKWFVCLFAFSRFCKNNLMNTTELAGRMWCGSKKQPLSFGVGPYPCGRIQDLFFYYFFISAIIFDIFTDFSGKNSWILMKKAGIQVELDLI